MSPKLLVLWDIDHTLIETRGVSTRLFGVAFERVTGQPLRQVVRYDGRTEPDVFADTVRWHGLPSSDHLFATFSTELVAEHEREVAWLRRQGRALPGAAAALAEMARQPHIVQSVVTGNVRGVAAVKLSVYGLDAWLDQEVGGYGSDHAERSRLVQIAQERAARKHGTDFGGRASVLIGDTPADVAAARHAGAAVLAVASGKSDLATLSAAAPDVALERLPDPRTLLRIVTKVAGATALDV